MKVFISSLISGFEPVRLAAREAVTMLGFEPVTAEDFGARPTSPQVACMDGVRRSGAVVLLLGERYGAVQPSGLSATHEEYREARERCPVLAFVQEGIALEPRQAEFLKEVQGWTGGLFRGPFSGPSDLKPKIVQALHALDVQRATAPLDAAEVLGRALASIPPERTGTYETTTTVSLAIAGGPAQQILRPSEIENAGLGQDVMKASLFGPQAVFDVGEGTEHGVDGGLLTVRQKSRANQVARLDAQGTLFIRLAIPSAGGGLPAVLVEAVEDRIAAGLRFADWVLERVDPLQRLSHIVPVAHVAGAYALRTRREYEASSTSMSMPFRSNDRMPVHLTPPHKPRAALRHGLAEIVEDLGVLIARQWK